MTQRNYREARLALNEYADYRKQKKYDRKLAKFMGHDGPYEAYNLGLEDAHYGRGHHNPYPKGARHLSYEAGYNVEKGE